MLKKPIVMIVKYRIIIIAVLAVSLPTLAFILVHSQNPGSGEDVKPESSVSQLNDDRQGQEGAAPSKNQEEVLAELQKQQKIVTDKISSNVTFQTGNVGAVGEWCLENPEENTVIQQAEIYLGDTLIVKTEPVYPNQYVQAVQLLSAVATGEHEVVAYINYYDIDSKAYVSKAGYKIHMTVR